MPGIPAPIQVGTFGVATRTSEVCDMGERGVCYEVSPWRCSLSVLLGLRALPIGTTPVRL